MRIKSRVRNRIPRVKIWCDYDMALYEIVICEQKFTKESQKEVIKFASSKLIKDL